MPNWPRYTRYALSAFILLWVVAAEVSVFIFLYSMAESFGVVPPLNASSVISTLRSPVVGGATIILFVTTLGVAKSRYGSLATATVSAAQRAHSLVGWPPQTGEPEIEGRVTSDEIAWRLNYWGPGEFEVLERGCPFCGRKLVFSYLPRQVVHGPNTAFNEPSPTRETAAEAWEDVLGKEKFEERGQTEALECPQCNFSTTGNKRTEWGRDSAISEFQRHIEIMRAENPQDDPFASYRAKAKRWATGEPRPADIWDAYAIDAEDTALEIGVHEERFSKAQTDSSQAPNQNSQRVQQGEYKS